MELDVSRALLAQGTEFPFQASQAIAPQDVIGETVTFDEVSLTGTFRALEGVVHLHGELTTTAHATCAMCLKPANIPLSIPFHEMFRKDANEIEDEAFHFEGNRVALDQLALTLVMLNLPMRFLCEEGCQGGEVGRLLSEEHSKSSCEEELPTQRPFDALQRLLTKDEEV